METKINDVKAKYNELTKQFNDMQLTVNHLQQVTLSCDVIIRGVPEVELSADDLLIIVKNICGLVNTSTPVTINAVCRIGKIRAPNVSSQHRPILMKLSHADEKKSLLASKRKIQISCDKILLNDNL